MCGFHIFSKTFRFFIIFSKKGVDKHQNLLYNSQAIKHGSLVKRLRHGPLKAKTTDTPNGVSFVFCALWSNERRAARRGVRICSLPASKFSERCQTFVAIQVFILNYASHASVYSHESPQLIAQGAEFESLHRRFSVRSLARRSRFSHARHSLASKLQTNKYSPMRISPTKPLRLDA